MKLGIYNTTPERSWYIDNVFSILKNNGYNVHLTDKPEDCFEDDITIGFVDLKDTKYQSIYKKSKCVVFLQAEQISNNENNLKDFLKFEKYSDVIITLWKESVEFTSMQTSKPVVVMTPGYHENFDHTNSGRTTSVPWEVFNLDLGFLTDNRIDFYCALNGTDIIFNRQTRFGWDLQSHFVKNSKICLNVHGWGPDSYLPNMKIVCRYMCNKGFVMSQRSNDTTFIENKHIVYFDTPGEMIDKIRYYLYHQDEARQIAENAYNFIKKNLRLEDNVKNAIIEIEEIKGMMNK